MSRDYMLQDACVQVIEDEVKRRILMEGRCYASPIEGYGDMTGALNEVISIMNETKKQYKKLLPLIRQANPQALHDELRGMQIFAKSLTVYSAMLAATVERNVQTIARLAGGGDLLDLLEEVLPDEDDGEENDNGN